MDVAGGRVNRCDVAHMNGPGLTRGCCGARHPQTRHTPAQHTPPPWQVLLSTRATLHDPDLPVRIFGATAFQRLILLRQSTEIIRPILGDVIAEFFDMMHEIDNDDVIVALDNLIGRYGSAMAEVSTATRGGVVRVDGVGVKACEGVVIVDPRKKWFCCNTVA